MIHSLFVLIFTSIACSLIGVFLVLKKQSMITDAISHSVLLGIVIAFLITKDLASPLLIIGASFVGLITVISIEKLGKTKYVSRDDAVGVLFPMFFSLAIILLSRYARTSCLCADVVLMGEVIYAGLNTFEVLGAEISVSVIRILIVMLLNIALIALFFKELKLSTFDSEYATLIGLPMGLLSYGLMTLTSITSVVAFDAVGSILVISFFITPAASALLISKSLKQSLIMSSIFAIINSVIGYYVSIYFNASMSGMVAFAGMLTYMLTMFVKKSEVFRRYKLRKVN